MNTRLWSVLILTCFVSKHYANSVPVTYNTTDNTMVVGSIASVKGGANHSYAIGRWAEVDDNSDMSYAIGGHAHIGEETGGAIALGYFAEVYEGGFGGVALGQDAGAGGSASSAIGYNAYAQGDQSIALAANSGGDNSLAAIGASTWRSCSVAIGSYASAQGEYAFALGSSVTSITPFGLAVGRFNLNLQKDGVTTPLPYANSVSPYDPVFEIGIGTDSANRRNAMTVFRDGTARFEGPVEVQGTSGKVVLDASAVIGTRTVQLPDNDGALLSSSSQLNAALLTGEVPVENLPAVTQLTGDLPWSRISETPTTVESYGITNTIPVVREVIGGVEVIASAIRIKPQGDIPMLGQ